MIPTNPPPLLRQVKEAENVAENTGIEEVLVVRASAAEGILVASVINGTGPQPRSRFLNYLYTFCAFSHI